MESALCLLASALPGLWLARIVLSPVYRRAGDSMLPAQFSMGDLISLFIYLSAALALGSAPWRWGAFDALTTALFTLSLMLFSTSLWWIAVRAKIVDRKRRLAFLLIVPLSYLASMAAGIAMMFLFLVLGNFPVDDRAFVLGFAAGDAVVLFLCRKVAEWVAAGAGNGAPVPSPQPQ